MATKLKRSDILMKHTNRGRPRKPLTERLLKQRAAYQWRDARRIYLAGSFERWRKLKSRLQLKDSSLAWHLLETHDKGCSNCSMSDMGGKDDCEAEQKLNSTGSADLPKKDPADFYQVLVATLRQLCYTHLEFQDCVELIGLVCVNIDHSRKDNHSIKEMVKRGLQPKQRTFELSQSQHDSSGAESVTSVLTNLDKGDTKCSMSGHDNLELNCQANAISKDALKTYDGSSHISYPVASSSLQSSQSQGCVTRTSWDSSGEYSERSAQSLDETESAANNRGMLCQKQYESGSLSQQSFSETVSVHGQQCETSHCFDETDHAVQATSSHHTELDTSVPCINKVHTLSGPWLTQAHSLHVKCMSSESNIECTDHCISCKSGETNKVVVSNDGVVSHVVHNGPVAGQIYRVDLSKQGDDMDTDLDVQSPVSSVGQREAHIGDGGSRVRAASMESNDSFKEVGIVSGIKHAQRLLDSPTDQPETSVSDLTQPINPGSYPSQPSDHVSAQVSLATDSIPVYPETLSLPNHTSVIKQICHPESSAAVKTETASSSCDASLSTEKLNTPLTSTSVSEGDFPLDMSVVKDDEDNTDDGTEFVSTRQNANPDSHGHHEFSHDEAACSTAGSPSCVISTSSSKESPQKLSATSSMQLLQLYTSRMLQQQEVTADLSPLHNSLAASAIGEEDCANTRKRKLSDMDDRTESEIGKGIPWPRKDMTQKEEYQYLESDPFMDFGEMTRVYPNMQQRTFYRWKRRIKDQYMFLEQQPKQTYSQFSRFHPQVREHVFKLWQDLIAHGHRFLGDAGKSTSAYGDLSGVVGSIVNTSEEGESSGAHKEGESGAHSDSFVSQYIFLQKNPSLDAEQFQKLYPEVPEQLFYVWKKQIISDFLKLQTNPKMTYQDFRKQASVTQDVFSMWKAHLALITNPTHLMSTCNSLVSASSSLSTATPTLPPVSLLAARAGSKRIGADLAAWYASYAPLMGQVAQFPFWSPLSIMSSPPLPSTFTNLRDNPTVDQEQPCGEDEISDVLNEKDVIRKRKSSESSKAKDTTSVVDKAGEVENMSPQMNEGSGNGDGALVHRGRRQSLKPEHYYYLLKPDTSYLALTRIFPGVSAQRYGRWRRKVSSALALLEREPNCTDDEFALSFPNIPDGILMSWRERVRQGRSRLMVGNQEPDDDASPDSLATSQAPASSCEPSVSPTPPVHTACQSHDSSAGPEAVRTSEDMPSFLTDKSSDQAQLDSSPRKQLKMNKKEYHFLLCHPTIDFMTFSNQYPQISSRTFYRWRRQICDNMEKFQTSLSVTLPELQKQDPEVTEEVFEIWSSLMREKSKFLRDEKMAVEEKSDEETETSADGLELLSTLSQSQQALQPQTDCVAEESEDDSQYSMDHVETADHHESRQMDITSSSQSGENGHCEQELEQRSQCRPEQHLVHMNPYLDYSELRHTYPDVSQRTFYRWKQEVHHAMNCLREYPDVAYTKIAALLPLCSEAFVLWQQIIKAEKLTQQSAQRAELETSNQSVGSSLAQGSAATDAISSSQHTSGTVLADSYSVSCQDKLTSDTSRLTALETAGMEAEESPAGKARRQTRDEFIEVMVNPAMDYAEFQHRFGTVSQRTFYRWRAHIRDWRASIRADPHLDYATFSRSARDVPEHVFNLWREWESSTENSHSTGTSVDSSEGIQHEASHSSSGMTSRGPVSLSVNSETSQAGSDQVKMLWMAYDYCHSHPDITFEGLSAIFPSVTREVFEQWQKGLGVMTEYIRSIPTTNFQDFHSLFPDIKEHVFKILKQMVLSQVPSGKSFLLSQQVDNDSTSTLPDLHSAYSAEMAIVQAGSSSSKHDKIPGTLFGPGTSSDSTLPTLYQAAQPVSHPPRLQSNPGTSSDDALNMDSPSTVRIKQESSPNTPLPSFTETVSNLGRLSAMVQHHLPQAKSATPVASSPSALAYPHPSVIASTPSSVSDNFSTTLAGIVGHSFARVPPSASQSADSTPLHQFSHAYPPLSLSGISHVASTSSQAIEDSAIPNVTIPEISQHGSNSLEAQNGRDDRGIDNLVHSSQRQRKLQRVEYMFVMQNPDVDVQEFLARFPKVSLRTFYRWKREIREEQQASLGSGSVP